MGYARDPLDTDYGPADVATNPDEATEAAARSMWDASHAVDVGVRPRWDDAVLIPDWSCAVNATRKQAALAVEGAHGIIAADALLAATADLEVSEHGRHREYLTANRHDLYLLRVRASEHLEGAR